MSDAKQKRPPGFSTRWKRSRLVLETKRRFQCFRFGQGIRIEQVDLVEQRVRQPVQQLRRVVVVDTNVLRHRRCRRSTAASCMELTKGSTPMKPVDGVSSARWIRCSPPPKPISSRRRFVGTGNRLFGGFGGAAERSMRNAGSRVFELFRLLFAQRLPLRRPKKASVARPATFHIRHACSP